MDSKGLRPLSELLRKEQEDGSDIAMTPEEWFSQIVSYGELHEEDSDWPAVAAALTRKQTASLFPAICVALIRGGPGSDLEFMACYQLLERWQEGSDAELDSLTNRLSRIRAAIFEHALARISFWWTELAFTMQLVELGVAVHSGRSVLGVTELYETFSHEFDERKLRVGAR